jgi:protein-L-isoaspartate(D-aspartate) O-methyltransferase
LRLRYCRANGELKYHWTPEYSPVIILGVGSFHPSKFIDASMSKAIPFEVERRAMIELQLRSRGIRDARVLEVMLKVPRHEFVPPASIDAAYEDRPLAIGESETISQPYIVSAMSEAAQIEPGDKTLEIGTGSGYQAAILAELGAKVYTIERNPQLAEAARARLASLGYQAIEVICGDGSEGYAAAAPYQGVLVTAAAPEVPAILLHQLADRGRMVVPIGNLRHQDLYLISKEGDEITRRILDPCQFVPLIGKYAWPEKREPIQ